jgi:hypothetical protein
MLRRDTLHFLGFAHQTCLTKLCAFDSGNIVFFSNPCLLLRDSSLCNVAFLLSLLLLATSLLPFDLLNSEHQDTHRAACMIVALLF